MSSTAILLIAPVMIICVAYLFGCVISMKTNRKWLIPNARFWSNILRSMNILLKSFMGFAPPAQCMDRSDGDYYNPAPEEFSEAHKATCDLMLSTGWGLSDYTSRQKDCDDYSWKMSVEIRNYIVTKWPERVGNKGVAVGVIGYIIHQGTSKGLGHVDVRAVLSNGDNAVHWPYPEEKHRAEKVLSQEDWDSVSLDIM